MIVNKKPVTAIIMILILAIVGVYFGYEYLRTMPQVSAAETKAALIEYKKNLEMLYNEFNSRSQKLIKEKNPEAWENFSKKWVQDLVNARPFELNKRIPQDFCSIRDLLMNADQNLLYLWQEYNKEFKDTSKDSKLDTEKTKELKQAIERVLEKVKL